MSLALVRKSNWPTILAALVEERRRQPFAWGVQDCMLWPADAIAAMTEVDLAAEWRGRYDSMLGAARLCEDAGVSSDGDVFGALQWPARQGLAEIATGYAQRGDLVAVTHPAMPQSIMLAIVVGKYAAGPGRDGLEFVPRAHWVRAWRVG